MASLGLGTTGAGDLDAVLQVVSGAILLWLATTARSDLYRTLQTSGAAFLMVFIP